MFMLMLRCGLRVEEVANLTLGVIDVKRRTVLIEDGKGAKDRVVYMSNDVLHALAAYVRVRPASKAQKKSFCQKRGHARGNPSLYVAFRDAWNIMPAKRRSEFPVIVFDILWLLRC